MHTVAIAFQAEDPLEDNGKDDTGRKDLKRTERPVTEKVSPEKKLLKKGDDLVEDSQPDLIPQTLERLFDEEVEIPPSTGGSADMIVDPIVAVPKPPEPPAPPAPPAPPVPPNPATTVDPAMVAALLDRIASLEAQVKAPPPPPKQPQAPLVTPPAKGRAVESPPTSSTSPDQETQQAQEEEEGETEAEEKQDGELLVMPSGKAVTRLSCPCIVAIYDHYTSIDL